MAVQRKKLPRTELRQFEALEYPVGSLMLGSVFAAVRAEDEKVDILGKSMALDELQAGIARLQATKRKKEADPDLDEETRQVINKALDKAIEKLRQAAITIVQDYEAEVKALADEEQKKNLQEALRIIKRKFRIGPGPF
ncbi:MAG: hypothetical protein HYX74_02180 [Acidobacteria bacterium]|nr:hypothetical protein [Acidobacteriota bacterium]